jgi:hypothetical protein
MKKCCVLMMLLGATLVYSGCAARRGGAASSPQPRKTITVALETRANQFWKAKITENWDAVFDFYEPEKQEMFDRDEFKKWSAENEMFQIREFELGRVQTDGEIGWAEVNYNTSLRRYPNLEPRSAYQWQKWRKIGNAWYPIAQEELDQYPSAPALRDSAAEDKLRERLELTWSARLDRDWTALYYLTDPSDYDIVDPAEYAQIEDLFEYLDRQVHWVEVIGDHGRAYVTYHHRLTDESLERLPPRDAIVMEKWVKRDNEWYFDLKTK